MSFHAAQNHIAVVQGLKRFLEGRLTPAAKGDLWHGLHLRWKSRLDFGDRVSQPFGILFADQDGNLKRLGGFNQDGGIPQNTGQLLCRHRHCQPFLYINH